MTVNAKTLVASKVIEDSQTTQYTATNVTAIIDKFTATNYSIAVATVSVNLVAGGNLTGDANIITKTKALQPGEVYTFPELVGHVLNASDFISTLASAPDSLNMRVSGREIT